MIERVDPSHQWKPKDKLVLQLIRCIFLILGADLANYKQVKLT